MPPTRLDVLDEDEITVLVSSPVMSSPLPVEAELALAVTVLV